MADTIGTDPASLFDLSGKVALVTGGSRGLGRRWCSGFAAPGADVVIASRKLDACEALARRSRPRPGAARCRRLPRRPLGRVDALVDAAYAHFGHVDVLVNNAGMSPLYDRVVDVTEELFDKVLARQPQGAVPADRARRHADGRGRRRLDHQRQQRRLDPARARRSSRTRRPRPA